MILQLRDDMGARIGAICAEDPQIVSTLSDGRKTLTFRYAKGEPFADRLRCEYMICTADDEYLIKDFDSTDGDATVSVGCRLNLDALEGTTWAKFKVTAVLPAVAMAEILHGTGWSCAIHGTPEGRQTVKKDSPCSALEMVERVCKLWGLEVRYDTLNKVVHLYTQRGDDHGRYLNEASGLKKLTVQRSSYDFYTRLVPVGKDGLEIDNDGKNYVEDHTYSDKVKTYTWSDARYTHAESLKAGAERKLADMCRPYEVYEVSATKLPGCELGEPILLISAGEGVKRKFRVSQITEHPDAVWNNTCQLANVTKTLADIEDENDERVTEEAAGTAHEMDEEVRREAKDSAKTQEDLSTMIANSLGVYMTKVTGTDGAVIYYFHDAETPEESSIVYTFRANGFAWTDDYQGDDTDWQYGLTRDGNLLIKMLTVIKITADQIDAAELKVKAANVTGKLTADQISVDDLTVDIANVTGELNVEGAMYTIPKLCTEFNKHMGLDATYKHNNDAAITRLEDVVGTSTGLGPGEESHEARITSLEERIANLEENFKG